MHCKIFLYSALFLFLISSCKKDSTLPPADMGYEYFPYEVGQYNIYQVDSIVWDDFNKKVLTAQYKLKEYVESEFVDDEGRTSYRLERSVKLNDTQDWIIADVWYANRNASSAEKVEENIRFIKLTFPISQFDDWDGNVFNEYESQDYEYDEIHESVLVNNVVYDSTIKVVQQEFESTLIGQEEVYEIYAPNVGLLVRYNYLLKKETVNILDTTAYHLIRHELIETGNSL